MPSSTSAGFRALFPISDLARRWRDLGVPDVVRPATERPAATPLPVERDSSEDVLEPLRRVVCP